MPYAIAARFAYSNRPAIALVGDGAMQMNGMAELLTIARHWQDRADPRLVVRVLHNTDLNQVTWEQRAMEGDPRFPASQELPDMPYAAFAELVGLEGIRVDTTDAGGILRQSLRDRLAGVLPGHRDQRDSPAVQRHIPP